MLNETISVFFSAMNNNKCHLSIMIDTEMKQIKNIQF